MNPRESDREFNAMSIRAVFAAWLGMLIGPNGMVSAPMSLFISPVSKEFHLTRTAISAILLISPWATAFFSPLAGRAIDRFGLRKVLLPGLVLFGVASMARGFVLDPFMLAVSFFVVSIASAMTSAVGYTKLVSMWFSRHRGLVLGLVVALGAGGGSALTPQIVRILIHDFNWRIAYIAMGAFVLILPLPLLMFLIKEPAGARTVAQRQISQAGLPGLTLKEALRTKSFYLIFGAIFLASMSLIGTTAHAVPMLTERGFSILIGATAVSCFFFGGVAGQLSSGFVADRVDSPKIALPYFFSALIGAVVVHTATSRGVLLGGAVFMGMGQGAEIAFAAYLTSRYFGLKAYGAIYSIFFAASNLGIGLGVLTMGVIHDASGSYRPAVFVFGGALVVAFILIALLGPYAYASRKVLTAMHETSPAPKAAAT
jgi:MFS family permease